MRRFRNQILSAMGIRPAATVLIALALPACSDDDDKGQDSGWGDVDADNGGGTEEGGTEEGGTEEGGTEEGGTEEGGTEEGGTDEGGTDDTGGPPDTGDPPEEPKPEPVAGATWCASGGIASSGTTTSVACTSPLDLSAGTTATDGTHTLQTGPLRRISP